MHIRAFILVSLLTTMAIPATAASVQIVGSAYSGPADTLGGQLPQPDTIYFDQSAPSGTLSNSATVPFTGCCGNTSSNARASADYGVLRASSLATTNGLQGPPYVGGFIAQASASAQWSDTLTFTQPSGESGSGIATVQMTLSGGLSASDDGADELHLRMGEAWYEFQVDSACMPAGVCLHKQGHVVSPFIESLVGPTPTPDPVGTFQFDLYFIFTQPLDISAFLWTSAYADGGLSPPGLSSMGSADFYSTATWDGVVNVRNSLDETIPFSVNSASGFNYATAATVPAPGALGLMVTGVAALGGFVVRRRGTSAKRRQPG